MFMGLFEDSLILRLPANSREELIERRGGKPFAPMAGRIMKEYVVVPDALLSDKQQLQVWVGKALVYGESLPPKEKRAARRKPKQSKSAKRTTKNK